MLKNSHRAFALSLTPVFTYKLPMVQIEILDYIIVNYNYFIGTISKLSIVIIIPLLLVYFFASTFPDVDHKFKIFFKPENRDKRFLYHRQYTHSLLLWLALLVFSVTYHFYDIYINIFLFVFILGVLTHLFGDMLTGSIPWGVYAPYYRRFSRIGVTIFLPKAIHKLFTDSFPKWLNKYYLIIFSLLFCVLISFKYM